MGCDISNGSICGGVTGGINSLHAPKIVEQDGSEFTKSFTKGETRTLKILNYNPSLKYIIRQIGSSISEIGTYHANGTTFRLGNINNHYFSMTVPSSNSEATHMSMVLNYGGSCGSTHFYDASGNLIANGSFSMRAGNYVKMVYTASSSYDEGPCYAPKFTVTWYKDIHIDEDLVLQIASDGTFSYTALDYSCTLTFNLSYEKFYLKSKINTYTIQVV